MPILIHFSSSLEGHYRYFCVLLLTANGFCKLKILQVLLIVLVGVQSLALVFVLKTNLKSVSTFQTSFKIFPQLDRNFHKSLKKFVSGPLLNSIEEVGQHFSEICCVQYTGAYFLEGPKSNTWASCPWRGCLSIILCLSVKTRELFQGRNRWDRFYRSQVS